MNDSISWDSRYATPDYLYGTEPNEYFKNKLQFLTPGRILLPAEGEGRNAVCAAQLGWEVEAFDSSSVARHKAMNLALEKNVRFAYHINSIENAAFPPNTFDAVALIYVHLLPEVRVVFFNNIRKWLKPGGVLIMECFDKSQLQNTSGGPKNIDLLYSTEMIENDFSMMEICELEQKQIVLSEGTLHQGVANVVRLYAKK